jgi:hypothetical protein
MYADVLGDIRSRAGICRDSPRTGKAGRRGVIGLSLIALSSFDVRFSGSLNFGDGDRVGGAPSESERALEEDLEAVRRTAIPSPSFLVMPSPGSSEGVALSFN